MMSGTSYIKNVHWFPCSVIKLKIDENAELEKNIES